MSDGQRIRTFFVDDHQVVRMGLKTMLESEPDIHVVGMAASAREALNALAEIEADVLLTDLHMGEMGGDALIREVRKLFPKLHCAVLTNYHSDEDVFCAIKAGAMAYILKSAPLEIEARHLRQQDFNILVSPQYGPDRRRDLPRREPGRRHLVEQRQERVEVVLIYNRYAHRAVHEFTHGGQTRESATHHHHVRHRAQLFG